MRPTRSSRRFRPGAGLWFRSTFRVALLGLLLSGTGCVYTTLWDVHEDLVDRSRDPIDFQVTSTWGLHFFTSLLPLIGDGSLENAMRHFQDAARGFDAQGIRIAQTDTTVYWWVLPPLSFIFPLVETRVTGDIQYVQPRGSMDTGVD